MKESLTPDDDRLVKTIEFYSWNCCLQIAGWPAYGIMIEIRSDRARK